MTTNLTCAHILQLELYGSVVVLPTYQIDQQQYNTFSKRQFWSIIFPLRKYKVPMSSIIPFPKRNDPSSALDFPSGRQVLAVYPGTTALYKATVVNGHRKVTTPLIRSYSLVNIVPTTNSFLIHVELTTCFLLCGAELQTILYISRGRRMSKCHLFVKWKWIWQKWKNINITKWIVSLHQHF